MRVCKDTPVGVISVNQMFYMNWHRSTRNTRYGVRYSLKNWFLEKKKYRTPQYQKTLSLILNAVKRFGGNKKGQPADKNNRLHISPFYLHSS